MLMYDTETLESLCRDYMNHCHNKPTRKGLADWLQISSVTITNVIHGYYHGGTLYTLHPHISRKIDNADFELIRNIFG